MPQLQNARKEFESSFNILNIKCAIVQTFNGYEEEDCSKDVQLKVGHTPEELERFLQTLDFDYDDGYGSQQLYGTVWLKDGTWGSRGEYDGSEWWEYNKLPEIPDELL